MKIDRLIGIITTLQQKGQVTAPYLAKKFEVSRRTVSRDIDDICRAGIPIVTTQGANGGIKIMDGFNIDTTVFTEDELQYIFIGLKSLDSVSKSPKAKKLSEKIGRTIQIENNMIIDLSSFYKDSLSEKIELIKKAIREKTCVSFHYYYSKGENDRLVEPSLIVFKWSSWYLFGLCRKRNDFRMFKLNRIWNLQLTNEHFEQKEIPPKNLDFGQNITDSIKISAVYEASAKYKLIDEYGPYSFKAMGDGRLYTQLGFTSYESAISWFLGFGSQVKILAPEDFKEKFREEVKKILSIYK